MIAIHESYVNLEVGKGTILQIEDLINQIYEDLMNQIYEDLMNQICEDLMNQICTRPDLSGLIKKTTRP